MIVQYYKPNAKNTGCAFSFDIGANNRDVSLTFTISEGSQHRIGKIVLDETEALPSEQSNKLILDPANN